jgi:hypothetical protein
MKTASFSFVAKFPAKKVKDCFTNPAFAKLHTASKLFSKAGIIKTDKTMIVRTLALGGVEKVPVIAVINFADADAGKATTVEATFVNVPDDKAVALKALGKTINADIAAFCAPKPAKKAAVKKAPAKKADAKAASAKAAKAPAKKAADKVAKTPAAKKVAKKAVAKVAKAPAKKAPKAAAKKPVAKPVPVDAVIPVKA